MYMCMTLHVLVSETNMSTSSSKIVSCSGYAKDGSLRIVRSGVGLIQHITTDLTGVKGHHHTYTHTPTLEREKLGIHVNRLSEDLFYFLNFLCRYMVFALRRWG